MGKRELCEDRPVSDGQWSFFSTLLVTPRLIIRAEIFADSAESFAGGRRHVLPVRCVTTLPNPRRKTFARCLATGYRDTGAKTFGPLQRHDKIGGVITPVQTQRRDALLRCASREAEGYLELGMHAHAVRSLQRRGQLVHSDARACFLLGESLRELHRYREALYPLMRAAQLKPSESNTWLALGWCYKRSGQIERAAESLERALRFTPDEAILHYNLACYYSLLRKPLAALRRLKRAITLDPAMKDLVASETDFEPLRRDPAFELLLRSIL